MHVLTVSESLCILDALTRDLSRADRARVRRLYLLRGASLMLALDYAAWLRDTGAAA